MSIEPDEVATKPGDDLVGPAEDVSARGPSRYLRSLHGGADDIVPETPEARQARISKEVES